ncbi:MAG: hypothetical protein HYS12_26420 [Planctomycetes bacterium]|nr:hypothetical protein [Planctomycetota bacterium]
MDAATRQLIERLHRAPNQYVLAVTGGGTQTAAHLLNVPGGSRTILEILVPYHAQSLSEFLGGEPEQNCSAETGRAMARSAFERARHLAPRSVVAGFGCTASLATDRPKRGEHRFHLAAHTAHGSTAWSLTLSKGLRNRAGEEAVVDAVLLNAIAETVGVPLRLPLPLVDGETLHVESVPASATLARLFRGESPTVCAEVDGRLTPDAARPALLLSGSFNPLHAGHLRMAEVASRRAGLPAAFELSIDNVDKPSLCAEEVCRRLRQFSWRAPVWLTRAPVFVRKAQLFCGTSFVVGYDTVVRLVAKEYYGDSESRMIEALDAIRACGCRFLVAGRVDEGGTFRSLEHVRIPESHRDLFDAIPEAEFRADLSSTKLRTG